MYNSHLDLSFILTPKHSHILAKGSKIVSLSQPCREIDEGKFLCYDSNVSSEEESKCITDLMTFSMKITSCLPLPVNASTIKVKAIQPDSWIIFAGFSTFLTEYCDNDMSQHDIMGTYIITLNNACEVKLGTTTLRKHRLQTGDVEFRSSPAIHLPNIMTPKDTVPRKTISLDEINLENLQFLSHALKDNSEVINSEGHFVNVHSNTKLHNIQHNISLNLQQSTTQLHYIGPEYEEQTDRQTHDATFYEGDEYTANNDDIGDDDDDDEIPLVMLQDDVKSKRRSSYEPSPQEIEIKLEPILKEEFEEEIPIKERSKRKRKKEMREGFSSRMVQETDEYVVIKLSKEEEHGDYKCDICSQYCHSLVSLRGHIKSHTTR
ncbi:hypothetical protein HF086_017277 [Spodoptera exigua]|uniref:C2H2-type domain-containing protein n=1 Tax=Spodoptera exigua TaxID=7107 RepID=A0A922LZZ0_SPOEX|nr:hypothetical protein HF086_017277 [Spodoptera exigua]